MEKSDVIQTRSSLPMPQDCLDFRAEHQRVIQPGIEQRLNAETVTDEIQDLIPLVQKGNSKFATQVRHKIFTVFFVQMNNNLGVAAGAKTMAPRFEILGDILESVQFAIQDYPDRAILVRERLTAI